MVADDRIMLHSDAQAHEDLKKLMLNQYEQTGQVLMKSLKLLADAVSSLRANIPPHPSILTGQMWVGELLNGHPDRIRKKLGVRKHVFRLLVDELVSHGYTSSKDVMLEEQLAIFLYTCTTGLACRYVGERFQRPNSTVSQYFCRILGAFSSAKIYNKHVNLPRSDQPVPSCILNDTTLYPSFRDAIGAIDGIHITCTASAARRAAARNQKGILSQNCLVACNFDLEFVYVLSGWEGSVADATVYYDARTNDFAIPSNKYFLADARFPVRPQLLVPYRGMQDHLPEWDHARKRPANSREYFNLRHTQLRNVIEHIISALKRRFRILVTPPDYDMHTQARIPAALCCIHNIIRRSDPDDFDDTEWLPPATEHPKDPVDHAVIVGPLADESTTTAEWDMTVKRDEIAEQLWQDHTA